MDDIEKQLGSTMKIEEWEILSKLPDKEIERLSRIKAAGGLANAYSYEVQLERHRKRLAGEYDEMENIAKYHNKVCNDMINEQVATESVIYGVGNE